MVQKEMINENINGYPAVLLTKKAPSGRAIHELAWYSVDKMHVLLITSNGAD